MREATQVASSAALSGSHHKAPGFAGGYLLKNYDDWCFFCLKIGDF